MPNDPITRRIRYQLSSHNLSEKAKMLLRIKFGSRVSAVDFRPWLQKQVEEGKCIQALKSETPAIEAEIIMWLYKA